MWASKTPNLNYSLDNSIISAYFCRYYTILYSAMSAVNMKIRPCVIFGPATSSMISYIIVIYIWMYFIHFFTHYSSTIMSAKSLNITVMSTQHVFSRSRFPSVRLWQRNLLLFMRSSKSKSSSFHFFSS
jgi:hypothetical protein